jgi:hypothetical protein
MKPDADTAIRWLKTETTFIGADTQRDAHLWMATLTVRYQSNVIVSRAHGHTVAQAMQRVAIRAFNAAHTDRLRQKYTVPARKA